MALPTNYQDDILDTDENTLRKYTMIANEDGTYSFEDATVYTQEGSTYSASITNAQNAAINALSTKLSTLQSTFQGGLEQIADTLTSLGVPTSAADSSEDFETNLATLASNKYAAGVSDTQVGTAVASQVLYGKTFTNSSGVGLTGTMTNRGAVSSTLIPGASYTIPSGYHNGSGVVTAKTLYSDTNELTISGNASGYIETSMTLISAGCVSASPNVIDLENPATVTINSISISGTKIYYNITTSDSFTITIGYVAYY